jgi:hypothetical protein
MSTQSSIERLRAANPVRVERLENDALFAEIVRSPGDSRLSHQLSGLPSRRPSKQLALVGLVALVLCAAGWTAVTQFQLRLFSSTASTPTPAELRSVYADADSGPLAVDLESIAAMGTFTTAQGTISVYAARAKHGSGFVTAYLDGHGKWVTGMGYWPPPEVASEVGKRLLVSSNSLNGMFNRVWQIWGIAPDQATRLDLHFRDGTSTAVPMHDHLFVYLVGGPNCQPGHRPATLLATDDSGNVLDQADPQVTNC